MSWLPHPIYICDKKMLLRTPDPLFLARAGGSGDDTNMEVANTLIIALYNFKCGWSNLILGISILLDKAGVQTNSIIQTISYRYSLHENHILCSYSEQSRSNSAKRYLCWGACCDHTLIPSNQPPKASLVSCTYMIELLHSTKHVALAIIFICQVVCAVIFLLLVLACLQSSLTLLLLRHCM